MLESLEIRETEAGLFLPLKAKPKASRNRIVGIHAGRLKVSVTAAPVKGRANEAILKLLADCLGLPKSRISLEHGDTSAFKAVLVRGMPLDELQRRIRAALDGAE